MPIRRGVNHASARVRNGLQEATVPKRPDAFSSPGRSRRSRGRSARRDVAAERWLLLLGTVAFIILAVGMLPPWSLPPRRPDAVEPMTMAQARAANAAVPIRADRRARAAAFHFRGGAAAREQAAECLATAALYEAGGDGRGQRAVIQVVLNRLRAPRFPRTVCGVVYQGYDRATGCQFSFTCDGSFRRRPVHLGWTSARRAARRALAGSVFPGVGKATHYHADWVVPYWRGSMTKVAGVGTHLFYVRGRPATLLRASGR